MPKTTKPQNPSQSKKLNAGTTIQAKNCDIIVPRTDVVPSNNKRRRNRKPKEGGGKRQKQHAEDPYMVIAAKDAKQTDWESRVMLQTLFCPQVGAHRFFSTAGTPSAIFMYSSSFNITSHATNKYTCIAFNPCLIAAGIARWNNLLTQANPFATAGVTVINGFWVSSTNPSTYYRALALNIVVRPTSAITSRGGTITYKVDERGDSNAGWSSDNFRQKNSSSEFSATVANTFRYIPQFRDNTGNAFNETSAGTPPASGNTQVSLMIDNGGIVQSFEVNFTAAYEYIPSDAYTPYVVPNETERMLESFPKCMKLFNSNPNYRACSLSTYENMVSKMSVVRGHSYVHGHSSSSYTENPRTGDDLNEGLAANVEDPADGNDMDVIKGGFGLDYQDVATEALQFASNVSAGNVPGLLSQGFRGVTKILSSPTKR